MCKKQVCGFFTIFHFVSWQEYRSGLPFSSPEDLPDPGIEPGSPELQADNVPTELWGKPKKTLLNWYKQCSVTIPALLPTTPFIFNDQIKPIHLPFPDCQMTFYHSKFNYMLFYLSWKAFLSHTCVDTLNNLLNSILLSTLPGNPM